MNFTTLSLVFETENLNFEIKTTMDERIRQKYEQNTKLETVAWPEFILGGVYKEACTGGGAFWQIKQKFHPYNPWLSYWLE